MFTWKKYVYEVYKERSFTKAAQNLYISQPSLSARIKKIEEIIGEPLFDRSTTPLQLTEVGKVYIESPDRHGGTGKVLESLLPCSDCNTSIP